MKALASGVRRLPSAWRAVLILVFCLMANAAAQAGALAEGEGQPFSLLGYQGDLALYRAELTTPPVTLTFYLHRTGGGLLIIKNRVRADAVASVPVNLNLRASVNRSAGAGATAAATSIETQVIGQTPEGGTVLGVFVDGKLTTIIVLDQQGRFVKAISVSS